MERELCMSEVQTSAGHTHSHQLKTALTAGICSSTARTPWFEHEAQMLLAAQIAQFPVVPNARTRMYMSSLRTMNFTM